MEFGELGGISSNVPARVEGGQDVSRGKCGKFKVLAGGLPQEASVD